MPKFVLIKEGPMGRKELQSIDIDCFSSAVKALGAFVPAGASYWEYGKWADAEARITYCVEPKKD